jgi:hypothetical protein
MNSLSRLIPIALALILAIGMPLAAQNKPAADKLVGTWTVEVNVGDQVYYLILAFKVADGKLEGALSEQSGVFTNVPLTALGWDGTVLKFDCKIPTPPDGTERITKSEMKYQDGKLAGTITVEETSTTASMTATKK